MTNPLDFNIANRSIGVTKPPFIIAEMSGNHNQSLDRAFSIVEAAAHSGAHAIKLQTYTADSITLNVRGGDFEITDKSSLWYGNNLHQLYSHASTPWEWHEPIFNHAKDCGLICFSSPFDEKAVDFLESLDTPAYKIASFENCHLPLIKKVAQTGKPLIISTGLASIAELDEAVKAARSAGCKDLALLKCTSSYPASPHNTNIRTIPHLASLFSCHTGLSDHTLGLGVSVASVPLGACIIEKHFCLSREDGGVDSAFSLEPSEFRDLVDNVERAWQSLGSIHYGPTDSEIKSLCFRRSIFISEDVSQGQILDESNLKIVRPNSGLHPRFYEIVLGRRAARSLSKGTPLSFDMVVD
ncbi:N-acetylneuraminate synthase [Prochlorococcus marinus str. MIT 9313]|uniref:N-acetylneuraminate synthase n=1 Tax=Prochlorococcus marinus (strain MIT 9313) TaxID=74547 RepID=Q7V953_PROMM|nr:pseudaminic acid synthase [Prochlorococcus marinus]CAE20281.1 N-acetylneuraminate synthase [Prochlorococcus marinus str. MIT 9313]